MIKNPLVNQKKCIGCGTCPVLAPKTFFMGKNGKAQVVSNPKDSPKTIMEAIKNCPVQAISMPE